MPGSAWCGARASPLTFSRTACFAPFSKPLLPLSGREGGVAVTLSSTRTTLGGCTCCEDRLVWVSPRVTGHPFCTSVSSPSRPAAAAGSGATGGSAGDAAALLRARAGAAAEALSSLGAGSVAWRNAWLVRSAPRWRMLRWCHWRPGLLSRRRRLQHRLRRRCASKAATVVLAALLTTGPRLQLYNGAE